MKAYKSPLKCELFLNCATDYSIVDEPPTPDSEEFPLTPEDMVNLAAWCLLERAFLVMLLEVGCNASEARTCMSQEAE